MRRTVTRDHFPHDIVESPALWHRIVNNRLVRVVIFIPKMRILEMRGLAGGA
jgi:hypothetical protein